MENTEQLWVEKYRPKKIEDCILPKELKQTFQSFVDKGQLDNMLLAGSAGLGKTTVARALCNELGYDHILINCSEDSGIDTLRKTIRQFASTMSLTSNRKVVILDEFDYANPTSFQPALRGFIEEFSDSCRFILTCNFKNRIIEPLHSRCAVVEFNTSKKILADLSSQFLKRLRYIFEEETVVYNDKTIAELIMRFAPDWRRIINECQRYSRSGQINDSVLINLGEENISELIGYLKDKEYKKMRFWVANNIDVDVSVIFRKLYDGFYDYAEPKSIPNGVITLAEYQYKNAFVSDREINMVACLTELMAQVQWK
jgi:DNA polymerase III delta prime subunit